MRSGHNIVLGLNKNFTSGRTAKMAEKTRSSTDFLPGIFRVRGKTGQC